MRLEVSCEFHFYNHHWFKNNRQLKRERGHCLEYHCIQKETFGTYKCTYQDTNGRLYSEVFLLMPTPSLFPPVQIAPYAQSLPTHSMWIEPHFSERGQSAASVRGSTSPNPSLWSYQSQYFNQQQQHPDRIEPHPSVQHPKCIETHPSVRNSKCIPSYHSSEFPARDKQSNKPIFQGIHPHHTNPPVIQHSEEIEPLSSCQNVRQVGHPFPLSLLAVYIPMPSNTVRD